MPKINGYAVNTDCDLEAEGAPLNGDDISPNTT